MSLGEWEKLFRMKQDDWLEVCRDYDKLEAKLAAANKVIDAAKAMRDEQLSVESILEEWPETGGHTRKSCKEADLYNNNAEMGCPACKAIVAIAAFDTALGELGE